MGRDISFCSLFFLSGFWSGDGKGGGCVGGVPPFL